MFAEINLPKILKLMKISYIFEILDKTQSDDINNENGKIIEKYGIINVKSEYRRAIGNAMNHGSYPIKCSVYIGKKKRMICVITDSGQGFDYKQMIKKYQAGEIYYKLHGYGTKCLAQNRYVQVDWEDEGKTIILYYNGNKYIKKSGL